MRDRLSGQPHPRARRAAGIRPIIVRQERTGLHMADAIARVTSGRKVGVFAMQHGPGTENAYGGVAQAYSESVPIVVMPMGYARAPHPCQPQLQFSASTMQQHHQVGRAGDVGQGSAGRHAPRLHPAQKSGAAAPVLVEVPVDVLAEEIDGHRSTSPGPRLRSGPDPEAVRRGRGDAHEGRSGP